MKSEINPKNKEEVDIKHDEMINYYAEIKSMQKQ